jgi:hypothetical protein
MMKTLPPKEEGMRAKAKYGVFVIDSLFFRFLLGVKISGKWSNTGASQGGQGPRPMGARKKAMAVS